MKTLNVQTLLRNGELNAFDSARLVILDGLEKSQKGKGFLTSEERRAIIDNPNKDNEKYNKLVNLSDELDLNMANAVRLYLEFKVHTLELKALLHDYNVATWQEEVLSYMEYEEKYADVKFSKMFKDELSHAFFLMAPFVYFNAKQEFDEKYNKDIDLRSYEVDGEELKRYKSFRSKNVFQALEARDISHFKDYILRLSELRKFNWQNFLGFYELIDTAGKVLKIDNYIKGLEPYKKDIEEVNSKFEFELKQVHTTFELHKKVLTNPRDPNNPRGKKLNFATYKAISDEDRKVIDEFYQDFKTELTELDEDFEFTELYQAKKFEELAEIISKYPWNYAIVSITYLKKYADGDLKSNALKWLKDGHVEKEKTFTMLYPDVIKRYQEKREELRPKIKEFVPTIKYDGFLKDCFLSNVQPMVSEEFTDFKNYILSFQNDGK